MTDQRAFALRGGAAAAVAALALIALTGCLGASPQTVSPATSSSATPRPMSGANATSPTATSDPDSSVVTATFRSVTDGDTIETSIGTVRIIGIDTPERGECGHDEASTTIGRLVSGGDPVVLTLPDGENDQDDHGRLLRYVTAPSGLDIGLVQLESGNAIARYDSRDGYPAHPKEDEYHAAQIAQRDATGLVITTSCAQAAPETTQPEAVERWWRNYSSCSKLKKNTVGDPKGPFSRDDPAQAEIYDWFENGTGNHGDGDGDGLACE